MISENHGYTGNPGPCRNPIIIFVFYAWRNRKRIIITTSSSKNNYWSFVIHPAIPQSLPLCRQYQDLFDWKKKKKQQWGFWNWINFLRRRFRWRGVLISSWCWIHRKVCDFSMSLCFFSFRFVEFVWKSEHGKKERSQWRKSKRKAVEIWFLFFAFNKVGLCISRRCIRVFLGSWWMWTFLLHTISVYVVCSSSPCHEFLSSCLYTRFLLPFRSFPNIWMLTFLFPSSSGRGVFAAARIPAYTVLETCPVLVLDPTENKEHIAKTELFHYT
jgi:hypothetical protein